VSRKKTRKWVEAKVQNYDGDDWGADEYQEEEESDNEPPAPPHINPSLRTFSGTDLLHSRHNTPSPASSLSALPSLRPPVQQQQQQQQQQPAVVPPASQPPHAGVASPVVSDLSFRSTSESIANDHVVSPQSVTAFQGRGGDSNLSLAGIAQLPSQIQQHGPSGYNASRSSSFEQAAKPTSTPPVAGDRFMSPLQNSGPLPPSVDQPPPVIYSPDNYSRLQDDEGHATLALTPVISTTSAENDQFTSIPNSLTRQDTRDTWERDDDSSSHVDQLGSQGIHPDIETQAGIDRGRMSVSPKLPDLSRMSAFGADLFSSSSSNNLSKAPPISENQVNRGEEPATSPAAFPTAIDYNQGIPPANQSTWQQPPVVPAEDEDHSEAPGGAPLSQSANLFPGRNIPAIPPLRTPSPHEPRVTVPLFGAQGPKISPTEPLQPGRAEPLPEFENPQSFQRVQTYGTAESSPMKDSPLKENDVLSDEIMRTLSPSGATAAEVKLSDGPQLHPAGDRSAVRESSYTLMDYDSYWADTAADSTPGQKDASVPPHANLQSTPAAAETIPAYSTQPDLNLSTNTTSPGADTIPFGTIFSPQQLSQEQRQQEEEEEEEERKDGQQPRSSLRRRFSWEDEQRTPTAQAQTPTPLQNQPIDDGSSAPAVHLTGPSGQPFEPSVTNLSNESRSHSPVSQLSQAPPSGSGLGALALQTSIPSSGLPGHDSSLPEPPSPVSVSVISDKPSTTAREQARLSIADEKLFADQGSVSLVTGTPPPPAESHPAVSSPTSAASVTAPQAHTPTTLPQAKAMNFRDIMALSTPSERIEKYSEARQILAARDSGLETWLVHLLTEHPELSASISAPAGQVASQLANNAALPAGSQSSSQQPYYQHYLNASSPSTPVSQSGGGGVSGGGRSRLGGLSMPSQMSGSAFGHSGNQIGSKSKEFMHSAGKMGKGLLSKGKSKLRGSGDKVFH
jgi:hypothetical protein